MGNPWASSSVASTWKPSLLGQSKPTASSSAEIAKIQVSRSRIHPYLETEIRLKTGATFMASVGHQRVGLPPLGPKTNVAKARRPHQAGLLPAWNPTCLRQQRPTSLCSLPTPSSLGEVKNQQPPALLKFAKIQLSEVGSPLLGSWNSLKQFKPYSWQLLGTLR